MAPKALDLQAPCPACGGSFRKAPQPTEAMRKKAVSTNLDYVPLPTHYDTAPREVVQELGELWKCTDCGMPHREKPAETKKAPTTKKREADAATEEEG